MSFLALVWAVAGSSTHYVYDEVFHIRGAHLLASGKSFRALLTTPIGSAAGPLYPVVHWLLAPLTGLQAPAIRWVNIALLAAIIAASAATLRLLRFDRVTVRACMLLAIPTIWVTAGMALTEIPAVAMMTACVLTVAWAMTRAAGARVQIWAGFALAGLLFGCAVLGRQPFLPAVVGFAAIALFAPAYRWPASLATVLAIALPAPVFLAWHGLVPPDVRYAGGQIRLDYGMLGLAYTAVFAGLLAPRYFLARGYWVLAASIAAALITLIMGGVQIQIGASVARHLPPSLAHLVQIGVSMSMIGGGTAFLLSTGVNIWAKRGDRVFVLLALLTLGMALTPTLVSYQFSSRYLMMTLPFLFFAVQPFFRVSWWAAARLAAGATFGYLSLQAYLHFGGL